MTLVHVIRLHERYISSVCCQRPYHVESTGSRPITEVKQRRAWLVLGWVTAWEHRVLLTSFLGGRGGGNSPIFCRRYKQHDNVIFCFVFRFGVVLFVFKEREEEEENASSDAVLTLTPILPFHFQRVLLATM